MAPEISSAPHTRPRIRRKYLRKRRPRRSRVTSACCSMNQSFGFKPSPPRSLYHLVRAHQHRLGNGQAERPGGFEVDDQIDLARLLDRDDRRIDPFQDLVDVMRAAPPVLFGIASVTEHHSRLGPVAARP